MTVTMTMTMTMTMMMMCEPSQSKCTRTFHKSHLVWKFTGKMPNATDTTSIEHRALTVTVRTPVCGHTVWGNIDSTYVNFMNRMIICRPIWPEAWIGDPLLFVCLISPQSFSASLSFRLKEGGVQHWSWCEGGIFLGLSDWSWCKDSFIQILDLGQCSWSVHWSAKDVIPKATLEKDLQDSTSFCSN